MAAVITAANCKKLLTCYYCNRGKPTPCLCFHAMIMALYDPQIGIAGLYLCMTCWVCMVFSTWNRWTVDTIVSFLLLYFIRWWITYNKDGFRNGVDLYSFPCALFQLCEGYYKVSSWLKKCWCALKTDPMEGCEVPWDLLCWSWMVRRPVVTCKYTAPLYH